MAVYVTGDCHQDMRKIYTFADRMDLGPDDHVIVLGDMGIFWRHDKADAKVIIKDFEARFNFNLYFVDGNHENFKILKTLDTNEKDMGIVSPHIHWLKRGRRYNIGGKDILALGGADSIDKYRRTEGLSWWPDEAITDEDVSKVEMAHYDYVLTHCCPISVFNNYKPYLCTLGNIVDDTNPEFHISDNKLEQVLGFITFGHWYFGHYHVDLDLDEDFTCLFNGWRELE